MKYIKKYEKYTHTKQDILDDMKYIKEFAKKFEEEFEDRLNLETFKDIEFRSYLGFGANKRYVGEIYLSSKKQRIKYSITLETDINPNGITNNDDIGRTFDIRFEIYKHKSRKINNLRHFFSYARNMEEVMQKFDDYLIETLNIRHLTEEEKKQKKFEKRMRQFNL